MAGKGDRYSGLRRAFRATSSWVLLGALVLWTVVLVAALNATFKLDPPHTEANLHASLWALLAGSWVITAIYFGYLSTDRGGPAREPFQELQESMWRECHAMAQYALERGKTPDANDLKSLQAISFELKRSRGSGVALSTVALDELTAAHKRLTAIVAPAMPKTLALLTFRDGHGLTVDMSNEGSLAWLGQVRLVRMMLMVAIGLLPLFVGLALAVGTRLNSSDGLFDGDLIQRTQTACYLLVASALGAAFASLFKARRYIESLSYDDQYESSYWVRFVQGLLAGLILAVLLSQALPSSTGGSAQDNTAFRLGVPLLALVGGFSSDLVYRILKRVIEAIETLIQGSVADTVDAQTERNEARLRLRQLESEQLVETERSEGQQREIMSLLELQQKLPTGDSAAEAREAIDRRISALLSTNGNRTAGEAIKETSKPPADGSAQDED